MVAACLHIFWIQQAYPNRSNNMKSKFSIIVVPIPVCLPQKLKQCLMFLEKGLSIFLYKISKFVLNSTIYFVDFIKICLLFSYHVKLTHESNKKKTEV